MKKQIEDLVNNTFLSKNRKQELINDLFDLLVVGNCKTKPRLNKLETELEKLQKIHGEVIRYFNVHSACDSFKYKDGAVYRVKLERSFGKATLD